MRLQEPPSVNESSASRDPRRRPPWRQRLVEVERGVAEGFRNESSFFVYLFAGAFCVTAALVLGLNVLEWTTLVLSLTLVFSAEMFHQAIRTVVTSLPDLEVRQTRKVLRLGTAAVFFACLGAAGTIGTLFIRRILQIFS